MIPIQPILVIAFGFGLVLYLSRLRSKITDRIIVTVIFGVSSSLVFYPQLATDLARLVGVGRGADLVFYVSIPGLAFLLLLVVAKIRDLNAKLTVAVRAQSLASAQSAVDYDGLPDSGPEGRDPSASEPQTVSANKAIHNSQVPKRS